MSAGGARGLVHVEKLEVLVGPGFTENCYIIGDGDKTSPVFIIDPGAQPTRIVEKLDGRIVDSIILTHRHYDHIGAVGELVSATGARVIAHSIDAQAIQKQAGVGPDIRYLRMKPIGIDRSVEDGDVIVLGDIKLEVIHTPGHSTGSMCLYSKEGQALFAGDTMFFEEVGRTDLPSGNAQQQQRSIQRLYQLPDDTKVYCGHDADTTIAHEKRYGPLAYLA